MPLSDYNDWARKRAIGITGPNGAAATVPLALDSDVTSLARSGGIDLRVYDETADALVDHYLVDWDSIAGTGLLWFEASDDSHTHKLLYGNPAASSVSSFANTFVSGTGFDVDWGSLTTATAGSGVATRYAAPADLSDARSWEFWRLDESPALKIADVQALIPGLDSAYTGVREITLLRDSANRVLKVNGEYVWFFNLRPNTNTVKHVTCVGYSTDINGPLTSASIVYTPPSTVRLGSVGSALKIGSTYYCFISYGGTTGSSDLTGLSVRVLTSTDLASWTLSGDLLSGVTLNDQASGACNVIGVPWVTPLADGTYWMTTEAYRVAAGTKWGVYSLHSSSPDSGWAADNSGNVVIGVGSAATWEDESVANPKGVELPDGTYLIQYNGASVNVEDFKVGFAVAATRAGTYTKRASNPQIGRTYSAGVYGIETSHLSLDEAGTGIYCLVQRFVSNSNTAEAYRVRPWLEQGGLVLSRAASDAGAAGYVLGSGTFRVEVRCNLTAHATINATPIAIALWNSAAMVAADTTTNHAAKRCLEVLRWSWDTGYVGAYSIRYYDTGGTSYWWKGAAWETSSTGRELAADHGRDLLCEIADDGTNYVVRVRYADDGTQLASASVAKASVRAFGSGRLALIGDPFTDSWAAGQWYRYIARRAYLASEPVATLGAAGLAVAKRWYPGLGRRRRRA